MLEIGQYKIKLCRSTIDSDRLTNILELVASNLMSVLYILPDLSFRNCFNQVMNKLLFIGRLSKKYNYIHKLIDYVIDKIYLKIVLYSSKIFSLQKSVARP